MDPLCLAARQVLKVPAGVDRHAAVEIVASLRLPLGVLCLHRRRLHEVDRARPNDVAECHVDLVLERERWAERDDRDARQFGGKRKKDSFKKTNQYETNTAQTTHHRRQSTAQCTKPTYTQTFQTHWARTNTHARAPVSGRFRVCRGVPPPSLFRPSDLRAQSSGSARAAARSRPTRKRRGTVDDTEQLSANE